MLWGASLANPHTNGLTCLKEKHNGCGMTIIMINSIYAAPTK